MGEFLKDWNLNGGGVMIVKNTVYDRDIQDGRHFLIYMIKSSL